jgi:hypothetical protein
MQEYEYRVLKLQGIREEDEDLLNGSGLSGWKLVSVVQVSPAGKTGKKQFLGYLIKSAKTPPDNAS